MCKFVIPIFLLLLFFFNSSNAAPQIGFDELMVKSEVNPEIVIAARDAAMRMGIPVSVLSTDRIMAEVKYVENGKPVYLVFTNLLNVYDGGYTAYYEELASGINFGNSRIDYGNGRVVDNSNGYFDLKFGNRNAASRFVIGVESTNDRVYIFNADNGDLIDTAFIPQTRPQLGTPKEALKHINGSDILICDQISDVIQLFNFNGTYDSVFAPIGGPNTTIVDNMRGMAYRLNNDILVSVGSGANSNTVQRFSSTAVHLGTFITGNLNTPFDVFQRENDILVSNFSGTNRVSRFDTAGTFISSFYTGTNFGISQQILELPNKYVTVAAFQTPSGLAVLDSNGTFIKLLAGITGNRGQYLLTNGNFLVTNSAGIHEIDSASGTFIRSVVTSSGFQYLSDYSTSNPMLRLTINFEVCPMADTVSVEARADTSPYGIIETATSTGGISSPAVFNFSALANGTPYYFVVRHRNSIATWTAAPTTLNSNYLNYNFTYANSQAYGNNQVNVGGKWSIYTGDVNQDETVDLSDIVLIFNDASIFAGGYIATDLNCDAVTDLSDIVSAFNNSALFISVIKP